MKWQFLELGDFGEMELAFATLKICRDMLDFISQKEGIKNGHSNGNDEDDESNDNNTTRIVWNSSLGNSVERRLCIMSIKQVDNTNDMTHNGLILRTFTNDVSLSKQKSDEEASGGRKDFVAGTFSPTNKWLYATTESGLCICFDLASGRIEKLIRDFGEGKYRRKVKH